MGWSRGRPALSPGRSPDFADAAPVTAGPAAAAFIQAQTRLVPVPLVPEIRLHVAADAFELWQRTEQRADREQLPPPFWGFPWAGGQALARYLLDEPGTVRGRAVLDIASGSGLVAIAAALAGAAAVTASDIDPLAEAAIELNSAANGIRLAAVVGDLLPQADGSAGDQPGGAVGDAEVVLAGDVFYERALARRLLPLLDRARAGGALVLVGDPGRAYLPRERFGPVARYRVPVSRVLENADVKDAAVWRLR
jgi:predicted nicotinamide N-methyase